MVQVHDRNQSVKYLDKNRQKPNLSAEDIRRASYQRHTYSSLSSSSSHEANHCKRYEIAFKSEKITDFKVNIYYGIKNRISPDIGKSHFLKTSHSFSNTRNSDIFSNGKPKRLEMFNFEKKDILKSVTKSKSDIKLVDLTANNVVPDVKIKSVSRSSSVRSSFVNPKHTLEVIQQINPTLQRNPSYSSLNITPTKNLNQPFKGSEMKRFSKSTISTLNGDFSLNELCSQPKQNHLTSLLSVDGQYSMIKVYDELIYEELIKFYPSMIALPRITSPRTLRSPTISTSSDSSSSSNEDSMKQGSENDFSENRKHKVSNFISIAMKILDIINLQKKIRNQQQKNQTDASITPRRLLFSGESISSEIDEDPIDMYLKWVNLWNKEFN